MMVSWQSLSLSKRRQSAMNLSMVSPLSLSDADGPIDEDPKSTGPRATKDAVIERCWWLLGETRTLDPCAADWLSRDDRRAPVRSRPFAIASRRSPTTRAGGGAEDCP